MGHAAAYSPLAKHRYEETSAKSLGPVYRYRNYTNQIVVVNDPALQQEVGHQFISHHLVMLLTRPLRMHGSARAGATAAALALAELHASFANISREHDEDVACLADGL